MSIAQTQTHVESPCNYTRSPVVSQQNAPTEVLTLRLVPRRQRKKAVRWAEDVVDNEFMGKKKSKKCCIFHKQRTFGDWSDDEDEEDCNPNEDCEDCRDLS